MVTGYIAALNGTPSDEVGITNELTYSNLALGIDNTSVTLRGGYADCSGTPSSANALLDGAGGTLAPVVSISAALRAAAHATA